MSSTLCNTLRHEQSPYLLQHAHNPVHWIPWSATAFEWATKLDRPIFLSVGYSACHWCHVMQRESFEDKEIAALMNENFINIKVDREERPDVDQMYMLFVQVTTGSGGWPMSVFLTPQGKPFFGGTYFPCDNQFDQVSFPDILHRVKKLWREQRENLINRSQAIMNALEKKCENTVCEDDVINIATLNALNKNSIDEMKSSFDNEHGGFDSAPKFPRVCQLEFLMSQIHSSTAAKHMLILTLQKMALGGLYDQVGGGFSRYSVDEIWHVPHFEKMLYDNAQLISIYTKAYEITKNVFFADVSIGTIEYVMRDLRHVEGGFFSAEDADSLDSVRAKSEGAFYLWRSLEIIQTLGEEDGTIFCFHFNVKEAGNTNFSRQSDPHGNFSFLNILIELRKNALSKTAQVFDKTEEEISNSLMNSVRKLFTYRNKRSRPFLDDKIILSWNAMMISALCVAFNAFSNSKKIPDTFDTSISLPGRCFRAEKSLDNIVETYKKAALDCFDFILKNLFENAVLSPKCIRSTKLRRYFRTRRSHVGAFMEDYAALVTACLDLYDITFDKTFIEYAFELQSRQDELFFDSTSGAYFDTEANNDSDESIMTYTKLIRMKQMCDGAIPSGNSITLANLARLARINVDNDDGYKLKAQRTLNAYAHTLHQCPLALPGLLASATMLLGPNRVMVFCGTENANDSHEMSRMIAVARNKRGSNTTILVFRNDEDRKYFAQKQASFDTMTAISSSDGVSVCTVFVCEGFTCKPPITGVIELERTLSNQIGEHWNERKQKHTLLRRVVTKAPMA